MKNLKKIPLIIILHVFIFNQVYTLNNAAIIKFLKNTNNTNKIEKKDKIDQIILYLKEKLNFDEEELNNIISIIRVIMLHHKDINLSFEKNIEILNYFIQKLNPNNQNEYKMIYIQYRKHIEWLKNHLSEIKNNKQNIYHFALLINRFTEKQKNIYEVISKLDNKFQEEIKNKISQINSENEENDLNKKKIYRKEIKEVFKNYKKITDLNNNGKPAIGYFNYNKPLIDLFNYEFEKYNSNKKIFSNNEFLKLINALIDNKIIDNYKSPNELIILLLLSSSIRLTNEIHSDNFKKTDIEELIALIKKMEEKLRITHSNKYTKVKIVLSYLFSSLKSKLPIELKNKIFQLYLNIILKITDSQPDDKETNIILIGLLEFLTSNPVKNIILQFNKTKKLVDSIKKLLRYLKSIDKYKNSHLNVINIKNVLIEYGLIIECDQCMEEFHKSEIIENKDEYFCKKCFEENIQKIIDGQSDYNIEYINNIPYKTLEAFIDKKLFDEVSKLKIKNELLKNKNCVNCPLCSNLFIVDNLENRLSEIDKNIKNNIFKSSQYCPNCKKSFCLKCNNIAHDGKSCIEVQLENNNNINREFSKYLSEELITKCSNSKCNQLILKEGGCNCLKCNNCKQYTCNLCKQNLDPSNFKKTDSYPDGDPHEHFFIKNTPCNKLLFTDDEYLYKRAKEISLKKIKDWYKKRINKGLKIRGLKKINGKIETIDDAISRLDKENQF